MENPKDWQILPRHAASKKERRRHKRQCREREFRRRGSKYATAPAGPRPAQSPPDRRARPRKSRDWTRGRENRDFRYAPCGRTRPAAEVHLPRRQRTESQWKTETIQSAKRKF